MKMKEEQKKKIIKNIKDVGTASLLICFAVFSILIVIYGFIQEYRYVHKVEEQAKNKCQEQNLNYDGSDYKNDQVLVHCWTVKDNDLFVELNYLIKKPEK